MQPSSHEREMNRKRNLLYGVLAMAVVVAALVAGQIYSRVTQRPRVEAVLASDADFSHVKFIRITGLNDAVEGYVDTPKIRERLYTRLQDAGATFLDRSVRIAPQPGKSK